jgi:hypothetical protein
LLARPGSGGASGRYVTWAAIIYTRAPVRSLSSPRSSLHYIVRQPTEVNSRATRSPTDLPSGIDDGAPSGWCDCLVVRATVAIFSPRWIFDLTESAWETRPSQAHARLPLCAQNGPGTSVHGTVLLRQQARHYPAFGRARDCVVSCGSDAVAWLSTDSRSNASRNTAAARPRSSADIASIARSSLRLGNSS